MADALLFGNSNLPPELDARVRSELQRDEQLLWVGQPLPGRFARSGCFLALFGVPFTAFALFSMLFNEFPIAISATCPGSDGNWLPSSKTSDREHPNRVWNSQSGKNGPFATAKSSSRTTR